MDSIENYVERLTAQIENNPHEIKPYLDRALYFIHEKNYKEAHSDINSAIKVNGRDANIYLILSKLYQLSGKTQKSFEALSKAVKLAPDNPNINIRSAELYLSIKEYKRAFSYLNEALTRYPEDHEAFFLRGKAFEELGDTIKAVEDYQSCVSINNQAFDAYVKLGSLLSKNNNPMAEGNLYKAIRIKPRAIEPLMLLGKYYQDNNQPDKAMTAYQEIITIDSTYKMAHYYAGYILLMHEQNFQGAIIAFTRALKIDPEYADTLYRRGYAYELLGKLDSAKFDYIKVMKMKSNNDPAKQGINRIDASFVSN